MFLCKIVMPWTQRMPAIQLPPLYGDHHLHAETEAEERRPSVARSMADSEMVLGQPQEQVHRSVCVLGPGVVDVP